jgi:chaperonin cofactor prefoldin
MEEEETALRPLQNQCDTFDEQKKAMEKEFEEFKEKIQNRM